MDCDEVLAALREREESCRRESERLRGEAERIAGLLAVCERELARVSTAREVVGELPVSRVPVGAAGVRVPAPRGGAAGPVRGRDEAVERAGELTARVLDVLAGFAGPVRCRQVVEALGLEATPREVERVRHQLKKAVAAGRVATTPGGLFTLARGRSAARG